MPRLAIARPDESYPLLGVAALRYSSAMRCSSPRCPSYALPCCALAPPRSAIPLPCCALASLLVSMPALCYSYLCQGCALRYLALPLRCVAIALRCNSSAYPLVSTQFRFRSNPSSALAVPVDATLRLCLQCFSDAGRGYANQCHRCSCHVLHGSAHIRGPSNRSISRAFQFCASPRLSKLSPCAAAHIPLHALPRTALLIRRLSARVIACAGQSLVKNWPTQPSALRGRPMAQGAG